MVYITSLLLVTLSLTLQVGSSTVDDFSAYKGLCGFVAATTIASTSSSFESWNCTDTGEPVTDPCRWGGVTCEYEVVTSISYSSSTVTGTLPDSIGSLPTLTSFSWHMCESFSGTIPTTIGSLTNLVYLNLQQNSMRGTIPTSLSLMGNLSDIYLSGNSLSGTFPSDIAKLSHLKVIYFGGNIKMHGTLPSDLGILTNLNTLNVMSTKISGTVPTSLCSTTGMIVDIQSTQIYCYDGCLTSSAIQIDGSVSHCSDGNQLLIFMSVTISFIVLVLLLYIARVWMTYYPDIFDSIICDCTSSWFDNFRLHNNSTNLKLARNGSAANASSLTPQKSPYGYDQCNSGGDKMDRCVDSRTAAADCSNNVSYQPVVVADPDIKPVTNTAVAEDNTKHDGFGNQLLVLKKVFKWMGLQRNVMKMAFLKLIFVTILSFSLNSDWTYCFSRDNGSTDADGNYHSSPAISGRSCTSPNQDACESFCGDTFNTTFMISTAVNGAAEDAGYCTAEFTQFCACNYWQIFTLVPLMLHIIMFALQCGCYVLFSNFDPQRVHYDIMLTYIHTKLSIWDPQLDYLLPLWNPWYCLFPFLEMVTVFYVWLELVFSPTQCGPILPLSRFYYPLLMTLLDLVKLNTYSATISAQCGDYTTMTMELFDPGIFFTYVFFTVTQALIYLFSLLLMGKPFWWYSHITKTADLYATSDSMCCFSIHAAAGNTATQEQVSAPLLQPI